MSEAAVAIQEEPSGPPPADVAPAPAPKRPSAPLQLRRHTDAKQLNFIVNHSDVRPWIADEPEGTLDLSAAVENRENVLLMGQFGGCMFFRLMPGIFEVHSQVLPEGRGKWALTLVRACAHWMFTRTDAYEIVTRVPRAHLAAKGLSLAAGMHFEFSRDDGCKFKGEIQPADFYSFRLQDWAAKAKGFEKIGEAFHTKLHAEAERLGITEEAHPNDPQHNHVLGIALEMLHHGQVAKGFIWYLRWSQMTRHKPIELISADPVVIKMDIGYLRFKGKDFEVVPC